MIGKFALLDHDRIVELLRDPIRIDEVIHPFDSPPETLSVDDDWHGIHFVLNQGAWDGEPPLDFIIAGGTEVGAVDVGYGPARAFLPGELTAIADALAPMSEEVLRLRFDADAMNAAQVYPSRWEAHEAAALAGAGMKLVAFVRSGAARSLGLVVWCE